MPSPLLAARALEGAPSPVVVDAVVAAVSSDGLPRCGVRPATRPVARHVVSAIDGVRWAVYEMAADQVPGRRALSCLVFDSATCVRRVWSYPAEWRALTDDALLAVSLGR